MNIYNEIRGSLQTFDALNCIPHNWFWGAIGHTAMVYVCKETGQVMVYESTQTARKDGKQGVQLRPMKEFVDNYPGTVKCRHVEFDDIRRRLEAERSCAEHIRRHRGTAYPPLNKWRWRWFLANAKIDLPFEKELGIENPDIVKYFFCTHLFVHNWQFCGLVHGVNPAEFEPDNIREKGKIENAVCTGVNLLDEFTIKGK